jgi:hypothetical protein
MYKNNFRVLQIFRKKTALVIFTSVISSSVTVEYFYSYGASSAYELLICITIFKDISDEYI